MRILGVHNRYQIRGGEEECYEAEVQLLQEKGHTVNVYEETNDRITDLSKLALASKTVWSQDAYRNVKHRLAEQSYDVVHVQNFFPLLSPSVYYAAKAAGVPVIQTLHNYRLVCPNGLFFRQGQVCEDCVGKAIPYPGFTHGCYRENRVASGGVVAMLSLHRLFQTWLHTVDCYVALTEFARQKFIEGGIPAGKVVVKPHFIHPDPGIGQGKGGYALFVGRLSVEKGLDVLLAAWEQLNGRFPLKIVGDGPLSNQVRAAAQRLPQVEWLGRQPLSAVYELMGNAAFVVIPSKWYETFGRVAVEAFAKGTPVITARLGAIAELVEPQITGLHFTPADAGDLATQVQWLLSHPTELAAMRQAARQEFLAKYTAEQNYRQLIAIYERVNQNRTLKIA